MPLISLGNGGGSGSDWVKRETASLTYDLLNKVYNKLQGLPPPTCLIKLNADKQTGTLPNGLTVNTILSGVCVNEVYPAVKLNSNTYIVLGDELAFVSVDSTMDAYLILGSSAPAGLFVKRLTSNTLYDLGSYFADWPPLSPVTPLSGGSDIFPSGSETGSSFVGFSPDGRDILVTSIKATSRQDSPDFSLVSFVYTVTTAVFKNFTLTTDQNNNSVVGPSPTLYSYEIGVVNNGSGFPAHDVVIPAPITDFPISFGNTCNIEYNFFSFVLHSASFYVSKVDGEPAGNFLLSYISSVRGAGHESANPSNTCGKLGHMQGGFGVVYIDNLGVSAESNSATAFDITGDISFVNVSAGGDTSKYYFKKNVAAGLIKNTTPFSPTFDSIFYSNPILSLSQSNNLTYRIATDTNVFTTSQLPTPNVFVKPIDSTQFLALNTSIGNVSPGPSTVTLTEYSYTDQFNAAITLTGAQPADSYIYDVAIRH